MIPGCVARHQGGADFMVMNVIYDEQRAMKAMCGDKNIRYEKWSNIVMECTSMKTQ